MSQACLTTSHRVNCELHTTVGSRPFDPSMQLTVDKCQVWESNGGVLFATRLKERRVALGFTQIELSDQLTAAGFPITRQGIQAWESGRTSPPVDRLEIVAAVLDCTPAELLEDVA